MVEKCDCGYFNCDDCGWDNAFNSSQYRELTKGATLDSLLSELDRETNRLNEDFRISF